MVKHITVANPDDEHGSPAYDGPADKAHTKLDVGYYVTTDPAWAVAVISGASILDRENR